MEGGCENEAVKQSLTMKHYFVSLNNMKHRLSKADMKHKACALYFLNIKPEKGIASYFAKQNASYAVRRASYIFALQKYASLNFKNTGYLRGRRCNFAVICFWA